MAKGTPPVVTDKPLSVPDAGAMATGAVGGHAVYKDSWMRAK